ncbi:sugar transferase [Leifsonia sp. A12D58]|uniref:sugar transferase n=1 Tax=Leifsonia sp. A12D58 TaxID=3397674 RepID=UPI0039E1E819
MTVEDRTYTTRESTWQRSYAKRLFVSDLVVLLLAIFLSQSMWIGDGAAQLALDKAPLVAFPIAYTVVSIVVVIVWMLFLDFFAAREHKNLGSGTTEYKRIADGTIRLFGVFAIIAYLFRLELGRGYFLTALPLGIVLLLASRWAWRQWLRRKQKRGLYLSRTILIGERDKAKHVAENIQRDGSTGLFAVAALTRSGDSTHNLIPGVPVLGSFVDALRCIDDLDIDTVVFTGADDISPADMRQLGWDLEARKVNLIVAPALTDVAGPRIHARPVAGLPLIHVDFPEFGGRKQTAKRIFDIVGAAALIIVGSPMLIAVAIAVRSTSPGPILYTQERIGLRGNPFGMLKFRSMVQGADDQLASLLDAQGTSDTPLFKVLNDPRITPVGKFIRKYSLDEFPQLFNVLLGHMSLVGPRPQRAAEVALYDDTAHRRLFMKPGMSGLWQVSGRSRLSWDDAIRLDLYYVENWSMTGDVVILWRTVRAVVAPGTDAH